LQNSISLLAIIDHSSTFLDPVAGEVVLDLFNTAFFLDVELVDVNASQSLLKPFDVISFVANLGLTVNHKVMGASNLLQILHLPYFFCGRYGKHLFFKLAQLVPYPALHKPALQFLLSLVVVTQFSQEKSQFVIVIAYFKRSACESQFLVHFLRVHIDP
jgi:hypothetical protein